MITRSIAAVLFASIACVASGASEKAAASSCSIAIKSPTNGGTVTELTPVVGFISQQAAVIGSSNVWVVIHPDGSDFWVERIAQAANGEWRAATQFGTAATPPGWHFEVQALVGPTSPLKEGD